MTRLARAIGVLTVVSVLFGGLLVAPASAQSALRVSASVTGGPFVGSQYHLLVADEAWGELAYGGPGATVQP